MTAPSGIIVVDKPSGSTSHDVVARVRRLVGTRRVGHAGTLDPMATGVLVVGVQRATRLLGYLTTSTKSYDATIRLGQRTVTDDAEGEPLDDRPATAGCDEQAVRAAAAALTGEIAQVPPQYSAVKVEGVRSYKRAREGGRTELAPRRVAVHAFDVHRIRPAGDCLDVDVSVACSSGTYVRALARDLGDHLGIGGHLTSLRRTRVGPYSLAEARTLDQLDESCSVLPLADAVAAAFPRRVVTAEEARRVAHGGRLAAAGLGPGPVGVFGPDGELLALMQDTEGGDSTGGGGDGDGAAKVANKAANKAANKVAKPLAVFAA